MKWIKIDYSDVVPYLSVTQTKWVQRATGQPDQGALIQKVIEDVVLHVRSLVRANPGMTMNEDEKTIPEEFRFPTCLLIVETLSSTFPQTDESADQRPLAKEAREFLTRFSKGEFLPPSHHQPTFSAHYRQRLSASPSLAGL